MNIDEFVRRRIRAAEEFNSHESRSDGVQVASSLSAGLTILRDALYARVHDDVERVLGMDSALAPSLTRRRSGSPRRRSISSRSRRRRSRRGIAATWARPTTGIPSG